MLIVIVSPRAVEFAIIPKCIGLGSLKNIFPQSVFIYIIQKSVLYNTGLEVIYKKVKS